MSAIPPGAVTAAMGVASTHADVERWRTAAEGTVGGLLMRKQLLTEALEAAAPVLAAELAELRTKIAEYENAVTWNTSCLSCAKTLDSSIAEHERAERATETERARWLAALADHYLAGVVCNEATRQDNPVCGCSLVHLGWHNSIGEARQAWIDHVLAVVTGEQ